MTDAPPPADERRMTDAEGLMWRLEADPAFSSNVATITLLDQPADIVRLRRRFERAVALLPRLRQRVMERPLGLPPVWVDVTDVDLDCHIRHVALPAPGSIRQLFDLVTALLSDPFDPARPLWELHVIDGVEGGQGAVVQKMHHTVTDGENGLRISMQFLDLERYAQDLPRLTDAQLAAAAPEPPPTPVDFLREAMGNGMKLSVEAGRLATSLLLNPARVAELGAAASQRARSTVSTLADSGRANSAVWSKRSTRRHFEGLYVPFEPVKRAANELGGTLNVAFLTAAAAAAGAYHRELGSPVDSLRASMAISTRTRESGANAFTLARVRVPTGELPVAERFAEIKAAADAARASTSSASLETVASLAAALPTPLVLRLARQQTGSVDFATSNLRGSPGAVYIAGAKVLRTYPVGPLAGVAFNLTMLSYAGSVDMGLNTDPAAIAEPGRLRALMLDCFDELVQAGAPKRRGRATKPA